MIFIFSCSRLLYGSEKGSGPGMAALNAFMDLRRIIITNFLAMQVGEIIKRDEFGFNYCRQISLSQSHV